MPVSINNVLIVDDHQLFLDGLSALFQHHYACSTVLTANNAVKALKILQGHQKVELILLDIDMPGMNGHEFISSLSHKKIYTPVIVVSSSSSLQQIRDVLNNGVMGFIPKSHAGQRMRAAIEHVLEGNIYIPEDLQEKIARLDSLNDTVTLSPRQREVVNLIHQGLSNKDIAKQLFISETTVKSHVRSLFELFRVRSRIACARKAEELGFISHQ